jgi:hypothetical protein
MPSCCCSVILLGKFLYCKLQLLFISQNLYAVVVGLDGWDILWHEEGRKDVYLHMDWSSVQFMQLGPVWKISVSHCCTSNCLLKVVTHLVEITE